jgi:hypothetical protein
LGSFSENIVKIQVLLISDRNNRHFIRRPTWIYDNIYWILGLRKGSGRSCCEYQNAHFLSNRLTCFPKIMTLQDNYKE